MEESQQKKIEMQNSLKKESDIFMFKDLEKDFDGILDKEMTQVNLGIEHRV